MARHFTVNNAWLLVSKFDRNVTKKPAIPGKDEKPIHGLVSDKNFIVANAVENILAGKCAVGQLREARA